MCGRYAASKDLTEIIEEFGVELDATDVPSRSILTAPQRPPPGTADWNMAPSKQALVVLTRSPRRSAPDEAGTAGPPMRQLRLLTWGLVPSWAADVKVGMRTINARAESVLERPAYARAAASRRCLVPAEGWYEWQVSPVVTDAKGKPRRQPFYVHRADGAGIGFAGLYEFWRDPTADPQDPLAWLATFTILTTAAEPGLDRVHDRQPLVLDPADWDRWLDPATTDRDTVTALLAPRPPGRFAAHPVGNTVNRTSNNGPGLVDPVPTGALAGVVDPMTGEVLGV